MDANNIGDIPAIQELLEQTKVLLAMKRTLPVIMPLLKLLRIDVSTMSEALERVDELAQQVKEISKLPDRFNDIFSERGWVIYEMLNLDVVRQAINLAENGNVDEGEQILVDYLTPENVKFWLSTMYGIKAFKPRIRLAQLALKDYEEQRYHACIPVVLAQLDGLVNDLNGGRGFFASETELIAWNSISAHKKGLITLVDDQADYAG